MQKTETFAKNSLRGVEDPFCDFYLMACARNQLDLGERFHVMRMFFRVMTLAFGMTVSSFAEDRAGKIELEGVVEGLPRGGPVGTWIVSQRIIVVTDETQIKEDDGPVRLGARVEVEGFVDPDGVIKAGKIETED